MLGMNVAGKSNLNLYGPLKRWMFVEFEVDPTARRFRFKIDGVTQHRDGDASSPAWFTFNTPAGEDAKSRTATSLVFHGGKRFRGSLAVDDITFGGWATTSSR